MKQYCTIFMGALLTLASCSKVDESNPETIRRLDRAMASWQQTDEASRRAVVDSMLPGIEAFAALTATDKAPYEALEEWAQWDAVKVFAPDVESRIPSLSSVEQMLGALREAMAEQLPKVSFPQVYTVITPYRQRVMLVDSVMLIGINHYLGADYEGYASFEPWQRKNRELSYIPVEVAEALVSTSYPDSASTEEYPTLLSKMLRAGAVAEAKHRLLPNLTEAQVLGYDEAEWKWLKDNEMNLWRQMVERNLVFSVDPMDEAKILGPSPRTSMLHPDAPGSAGRYIGYKIVKAFVDNNKDQASLEYLLSPSFYNAGDILIRSDYRPR